MPADCRNTEIVVILPNPVVYNHSPTKTRAEVGIDGSPSITIYCARKEHSAWTKASVTCFSGLVDG